MKNKLAKIYLYRTQIIVASTLLIVSLAAFNYKIAEINEQSAALEKAMTHHIRKSKDTLLILIPLKGHFKKIKDPGLIESLSKMAVQLEKRITHLNDQDILPAISFKYIFFKEYGNKESERNKKLLVNINSVWPLYSKNLFSIVKNNAKFRKQKEKTIALSVKHGQAYQYELSKLNKRIKNNSKILKNDYRNARLITNTVIFLLLIATLYSPLTFAFTFLRKKISEKIDTMSSSSDDNLDKNIKDPNIGLLQLDLHTISGSQNSRLIGDIFFTENYVGLSFLDLLATVVDSGTLQKTLKYLTLLNSIETNTKTLENANPLKNIKVKTPERGNKFAHKLVQFRFRREISKKRVNRVLVYIKITGHASLAVETQAKKKLTKKPDMADTIMRIQEMDESIVEDFLEEAIPALEVLPVLLRRNSESKEKLKGSLDYICRIIHKTKGDAAILNFDEVVKLLHSFEDKLEPLQNNAALKKSDFDGFIASIDEIIVSLKKFSEILKRVGTSDRKKEKTTDHQLFQRLQSYIDKIGNEHDKDIRLINKGFTQADIPARLRKPILSMVTQLLRNAVIHGIEDKTKRKSAKKQAYGTIYIQLQKYAKSVTVTVRDDGAGLDINKIKSAAIKSGKYTRERINRVSNDELVSLILLPGFSTASKVDNHAGRGIGLDLVNTTVKELRGKLSTRTRQGSFTEFSMIFPY